MKLTGAYFHFGVCNGEATRYTEEQVNEFFPKHEAQNELDEAVVDKVRHNVNEPA